MAFSAGRKTALSVMGTPGRVQVYTSKTEAAVSAGGDWYIMQRQRGIRSIVFILSMAKGFLWRTSLFFGQAKNIEMA